MTSTASPNIYDENSVFRKLFSDDKKPRATTQAERLNRIFADAHRAHAPKRAETIDVADFLPQY